MELQRVEQGVVPGEGALIQQAGAGCHGEARLDCAGPLLKEVVAERGPAVDSGRVDRLVALEPGELGGPVGGVEHTAGAGVDGAFVQALAQCDCLGTGAGVEPSKQGCGGLAEFVQAEESVPEGGKGDSGHAGGMGAGGYFIEALGDLFEEVACV